MPRRPLRWGFYGANRMDTTSSMMMTMPGPAIQLLAFMSYSRKLCFFRGALMITAGAMRASGLARAEERCSLRAL